MAEPRGTGIEPGRQTAKTSGEKSGSKPWALIITSLLVLVLASAYVLLAAW